MHRLTLFVLLISGSLALQALPPVIRYKITLEAGPVPQRLQYLLQILSQKQGIQQVQIDSTIQPFEISLEAVPAVRAADLDEICRGTKVKTRSIQILNP